jgi:hypothetical protein
VSPPTDTLEPVSGPPADTFDPVAAPVSGPAVPESGSGGENVGSPTRPPVATQPALLSEPAAAIIGTTGLDGQTLRVVREGAVFRALAIGAGSHSAASSAGRAPLVAPDVGRMTRLSPLWSAGASRAAAHALMPEAPGQDLPLPGAPSGGPSVAPAGFGVASLYAVLVALAALAALQLSRLRLEPLSWRSAAVVALIERPG